MLLGIEYAAHFLRLVHSLDSSLAIYELSLVARDPLITAAIAGPHHSFIMLAAFTQGLDQLRPPPIKSIYLDMKDVKSAAALNLAEIEDLTTSPTSTMSQPFQLHSFVLNTSHICQQHLAHCTLVRSFTTNSYPGSHPSTATVYTWTPKIIS